MSHKEFQRIGTAGILSLVAVFGLAASGARAEVLTGSTGPLPFVSGDVFVSELTTNSGSGRLDFLRYRNDLSGQSVIAEGGPGQTEGPHQIRTVQDLINGLGTSSTSLVGVVYDVNLNQNDGPSNLTEATLQILDTSGQVLVDRRLGSETLLAQNNGSGKSEALLSYDLGQPLSSFNAADQVIFRATITGLPDNRSFQEFQLGPGQQVPEPATLSIFALGFGGLMAVRKRRMLRAATQ